MFATYSRLRERTNVFRMIHVGVEYHLRLANVTGVVSSGTSVDYPPKGETQVRGAYSKHAKTIRRGFLG